MLWNRRGAKAIDGVFHADTEPFFRLLVNLNYTPNHIVDVGAHLGGWTRSAMNVFPHSKYTLLEPQKELLGSQSDLDMPNIRQNYVGVGPASGQALLSQHDLADSSSFALTPEQARECRRFPNCGLF